MELACENGRCLVCKREPPEQEILPCASCGCLWHLQCLKTPKTLGDVRPDWECPDCEYDPASSGKPPPSGGGGDKALVTKIREINADNTLSDVQKAAKRQKLLSNGAVPAGSQEDRDELICIFCQGPLDRPVTTPCGHNFCLRCLQKWFAQGHKKCGKCRVDFHRSFIQQPKINPVLVQAIRMAKTAASGVSSSASKSVQFIQNKHRPDKAFKSERAKKSGLSNASSGRIFVTVGKYHFGAIPAENDPERNLGVLVGETWADRMECRQWGAHSPHVAGIAGQSDRGAQSVVMSGGYEDDEDHGEWFLYTGSGGRDLSGNKRTNDQSFDQVFSKSNRALSVSCLKGYPVRVVRSSKDVRSAYAPQEGLRYDGLYRIERCWRKIGLKGFLVCRYLFVRCDNEPAPWTSEDYGDRPRPLPEIAELKNATDVKERKTERPAWDWKEDENVWGWTKAPPSYNPSSARRKSVSSKEKELKTRFGCGLCKNVLQRPLCAPCGHNFCQSCLIGHFAGHKDVRERGNGRRSLRVRKNQKLCPQCNKDIADFLEAPAVNNDMDNVIQKLKDAIAEQEEENRDAAADDDGDEGAEEAEENEEADEQKHEDCFGRVDASVTEGKEIEMASAIAKRKEKDIAANAGVKVNEDTTVNGELSVLKEKSARRTLKVNEDTNGVLSVRKDMRTVKGSTGKHSLGKENSATIDVEDGDEELSMRGEEAKEVGELRLGNGKRAAVDISSIAKRTRSKGTVEQKKSVVIVLDDD
ncbi:E3 ubiquitin-protein ligase ORTHRUS 2 [Selaginella moellendorffii]|uniref:E3 ubiquitin-protein ligase ORTHRUS 2 n=1 Tax=Selaginella moellendorffii TaxID=88036 RepID=UPI000D1CE6DD|nr:E3 ubiquitin-protein ligase ORTHRUS 2 [Selaginella moellendorffii]|eukprot:XP_024539605.1 E3 ubiquitin-protein ligase ORTHRUS 2 [Selaginella moellendorffii]